MWAAEHAMLEPFNVRQPVRVDVVEPAQVAGERARFGFDRRAG